MKHIFVRLVAVILALSFFVVAGFLFGALSVTKGVWPLASARVNALLARTELVGGSVAIPDHHAYRYIENDKETLEEILTNIEAQPSDLDIREKSRVVDGKVTFETKREFQIIFAKGIKAFDEGRYAEAIVEFTNADRYVSQFLHQKNDKLQSLYAYRAEACFLRAMGMPLTEERARIVAEGVATIGKVYSLNPRNLHMSRAYAFSLYFQKQYADAATVAESTSKLNPNPTWRDHLLDALLYESKGLSESMLSHAKEGFKKSPENPLLGDLLLYYYRSTRQEKSVEYFARILRGAPLPDAQKALYRVLAQAPEPEKLLGVATKESKAFPDSVALRLLVAEGQSEKKGGARKAEKILEELYASTSAMLEREFWWGNLLYAQIRIGQGKSDDALPFIKKVLEEHPYDFRALALLGDVLFYEERYTEAVDAYLRAYKVFPYFFTVNYNIALCYLKLEQLENAKRFLLETLRINSGLRQVRAKLEDVKRRLGEKAEKSEGVPANSTESPVRPE